MAETEDERRNMLRVLISTDNHLGAWEKDELRKDDSFATFEEVFQLAHSQNADFVLLGGDLFHENHPSRTTMLRAMAVLKKYCLNDRPVAFEVLSDQSQNFAEGHVNYEDAHYNVGLPVFTIHGNHDDPTGADNSSAVDELSRAGLVNYFGKQAFAGSHAERVRIVPILIQKGVTKLALYGLGNMRDERLGRLFQTPGAVTWVRTATEDGVAASEWLNVFVLHQNRVAHTQSAKNLVKESHLARWLDLVVWGHEHECIPDAQRAANADFEVLQPGSTVATALTEGEAKRKHAFLLEMLDDKFRTVKLPLETVVLAEQMELDANDPKVGEAVNILLERKVEEMLRSPAAHSVPHAGRPSQLPLLRLKVDHTGFSTLNSQRFGQKFVGRVANPHDMLAWHRAAVRRIKPGERGGEGGLRALPEPGARPEAMDEAEIEAQVSRHLVQTLQVISEADLAVALHNYIDKDEKSALSECLRRSLEATQAAVKASGEDVAAGTDVERVVTHARASARAAGPSLIEGAGPERNGVERESAQPSDGNAPASSMRPPASRAGSAAAAAPSRAPRQTTLGDAFARRGAGSPQAMNGAALSQRSVAQSGGRGRGRGSGRTAQPAHSLPRKRPRPGASDAEELSGSDAEDELDLVEDASDEDDEAAARPRAASRKRAALPVRRASAAPRGRRGAASTVEAVPTSTPQASSFVLSSDEEDAGGGGAGRTTRLPPRGLRRAGAPLPRGPSQPRASQLSTRALGSHR